MPLPKLTLPEPTGICKYVPIDLAYIPIITGAFGERLELEASWEEGEYDDALQWVLCMEAAFVTSDCSLSLTAALEGIAEAISACCAGGGAVIDYAVENGMPFIPDEPEEYEYGEGSPPDGSSTWEDWEDEYCDRIGRYLTALGESLDAFIYNAGVTGGLSLALVTGILVLGGFTLPIAAIIALVSGLLAVIGGAVLDDLRNDWDGIQSDLLCATFDVLTPEDAYTALIAAIEAAEVDGLYKPVYKNLVSQGDINALWDGGKFDVGTEYDCSSCGATGSCAIGNVVDGTIDSGGFDQSSVTVSSVYSAASCGAHYRVFVNICSDYGERTVQVTYLNGWTPKTCVPLMYNVAFWSRNDEGAVVEEWKGNGTTPPMDTPICCNYVQLISDTAFTITFTFDDNGCIP
jgi:hypothetical protein